PARLTLNFPFFHLPPPPVYPGHIPPGYDGVEPTGGILTNVPILLVLPGVVPFLLAGRLRLASLLAATAGALTAIAGAIILALSFTFWGTTMRYEMDFTSLLLVAALALWFAAVAALRKRALRRVLAVGGSALVAWGALV